MGLDGLYAVYKAQNVSTNMVLKMFEEAEGSNPAEERVLSYLRQFVGNMGVDELRSFVRFATGSSASSTLQINGVVQLLSWQCVTTNCAHVHTISRSIDNIHDLSRVREGVSFLFVE